MSNAESSSIDPLGESFNFLTASSGANFDQSEWCCQVSSADIDQPNLSQQSNTRSMETIKQTALIIRCDTESFESLHEKETDLSNSFPESSKISAFENSKNASNHSSRRQTKLLYPKTGNEEFDDIGAETQRKQIVFPCRQKRPFNSSIKVNTNQLWKFPNNEIDRDDKITVGDTNAGDETVNDSETEYTYDELSEQSNDSGRIPHKLLNEQLTNRLNKKSNNEKIENVTLVQLSNTQHPVQSKSHDHQLSPNNSSTLGSKPDKKSVLASILKSGFESAESSDSSVEETEQAETIPENLGTDSKLLISDPSSASIENDISKRSQRKEMSRDENILEVSEPSLITDLDDVTVEIGATAVFECTMAGIESVAW